MSRNESLISRPNSFEIDLEAIAHNVGEVRRLVGPEVRIFAALKANAYGFGLVEVAETVLSSGADAIAIVDLKEAITLRRRGVRAPILLYAGVPPSRESVMAVDRHQLMPTILDCASAELYSRVASRPVRFFVKVDVGLERLGARPDEVSFLVRTLCQMPKLNLQGIYTHLHVIAGDEAEEYGTWQFHRFTAIIRALEQESMSPPIKMAASTAVLRFSTDMGLNAVDPGHMLFGLLPPGPAKVPVDLRPAFRSLKSQLIQIKAVAREDFRHCAPFRIRPDMRVGIVPIGLADGMATLTCGEVLIRGKRTLLLGKSSLEHTRVDLTDLPEAQIGDEVVIIGRQGNEEILPAEILVSRQALAPVEVALNVRESVSRIYLGKAVLSAKPWREATELRLNRGT